MKTILVMKLIVAILMIAIIAFVLVLVFSNLDLGKKLQEKDAEISDLKEENDELQEAKDKAIAEKLEEISRLEEERDQAIDRVEELEPEVRKADLRIERLEQEYQDLVASGASCEDLLKNALAQIDTLKLEVVQVKEQRDKALAAFNLEAASKAAALELADEWRQKYESEHTVRVNIESAYEMSKKQIRILKVKGTLGGLGGAALGFLGGLLLGK